MQPVATPTVHQLEKNDIDQAYRAGWLLPQDQIIQKLTLAIARQLLIMNRSECMLVLIAI